MQTVDISMPENVRPLMSDERCLPAIVKDNTGTIKGVLSRDLGGAGDCDQMVWGC